jgi:hypothetical protein
MVPIHLTNVGMLPVLGGGCTVVKESSLSPYRSVCRKRPHTAQQKEQKSIPQKLLHEMVAEDILSNAGQDFQEHASTSTGRLIGRHHFPYGTLATQTEVKQNDKLRKPAKCMQTVASNEKGKL